MLHLREWIERKENALMPQKTLCSEKKIIHQQQTELSLEISLWRGGAAWAQSV